MPNKLSRRDAGVCLAAPNLARLAFLLGSEDVGNARDCRLQTNTPHPDTIGAEGVS
jgi:hypothetical protein